MKLHPVRNKQGFKSQFRGRMMAAILASPSGQRVLRKCQEALDQPVNKEEVSRRLVIQRFAVELDILPREWDDLLARPATPQSPAIQHQYNSPENQLDSRKKR